MWPFRKIEISTRDRKEREVSFLGITVIQYGHKEINGVQETYFEIFPKSFEHKTLDKIISFLPKGNTYDHVWIVRTTGMGEALLLNYMIKDLIQKWKVKNPCFMSQRILYKGLFELYNEIPFYYLNLKHDDYAFYLKRMHVKYRAKYFHVFHTTIDQSRSLVRAWKKGKCEHACETYKKLEGINEWADVEPVFNEKIKSSTLEKVKKIGLNIEKFVFISPESQTASYINTGGFWDKLAVSFEKRGFDVFVNKTKGSYRHGKSTPLSVAEAVYLASLAKKIVALRSGFSELIVSIKERMKCYILYLNFYETVTPENFFKLFSFTNYPFYNPKNTIEILVKDDNFDQTIDTITNN